MVALRFNADELAAQALAGGGPRGGGAIYDSMSEPHRLFFAQLRDLLVGAVDAAGWPIATLLTGQPGFVQSADSATLRIGAQPAAGDPAAAALVAGHDIGILGIDLSTRRRNRANGRVVGRDAQGIEVAVSQSFGNCPQYIQRRTLDAAQTAVGQAPASAAESFIHLDPAAQAAIEQADTFFVASRSRRAPPGDDGAYGADISHRGGRPGFVRVDGDELTIPDFRGNRYFNTLGNLMSEPRASLLFIDFDSGDLLQLQGLAYVDWTSAAAERFTGAERLWRFRVARGWRRRAASPLHWSFVDYSRVTQQTGAWH
jgi:predicted pyridoxine 5'-phosphate oxidase superfamily flavin-nucleotide-binding protein